MCANLLMQYFLECTDFTSQFESRYNFRCSTTFLNVLAACFRVILCVSLKGKPVYEKIKNYDKNVEWYICPLLILWQTHPTPGSRFLAKGTNRSRSPRVHRRDTSRAAVTTGQLQPAAKWHLQIAKFANFAKNRDFACQTYVSFLVWSGAKMRKYWCDGDGVISWWWPLRWWWHSWWFAICLTITWISTHGYESSIDV